MTVAAITGVGAIFRRKETSYYEAQAEIRNINGPNFTRETHDVTTLDSTGGYREFIAGFRDGGTVNMEFFFTRAVFTQLKTDFEDDTIQSYEIILPDDDHTSLEFDAYVTDMPLKIDETPVTLSVTFKISGETTVDSGSG